MGTLKSVHHTELILYLQARLCCSFQRPPAPVLWGTEPVTVDKRRGVHSRRLPRKRSTTLPDVWFLFHTPVVTLHNKQTILRYRIARLGSGLSVNAREHCCLSRATNAHPTKFSVEAAPSKLKVSTYSSCPHQQRDTTCFVPLTEITPL